MENTPTHNTDLNKDIQASVTEKADIQANETNNTKVQTNSSNNISGRDRDERRFSLKKWWQGFSTYEKCWLTSLSILAIVMSILLPEGSANGFPGWLITLLYLFDVLIGNLCELLMAKQNRWGVLLYDVVEVIEITVMIMLRARFASLAVAMFYWIPAHTLGFIKWNQNLDKKDDRVTSVRGLRPWHAVIMCVVCIVWTAVIGYLMVRFSPETDFFASERIEITVAYMDACLSILSILNGILVYLRLKEAWTMWYAYTVIETALNIITGQWILLVYKLGYFTNTTYGLIKWSKYIKENNTEI